MAESPLPSLTETDPALTARFALSAKTSESQQRALTLCRKHLANSALPADKRAGVQIAAGRCAYELALNEPNQDVKTKLFQEVVDLLGPLAAQGSFLSAPGRNSVLLRLAAAQANLGRHTETLEALDKLQFSASLGAREAAEQKDAEALRIYAQGKIAAKQVEKTKPACEQFNQGNYEQAVQLAKDLLSSGPLPAALQFQMLALECYAESRLGRYSEAQATVQKALEAAAGLKPAPDDQLSIVYAAQAISAAAISLRTENNGERESLVKAAGEAVDKIRGLSSNNDPQGVLSVIYAVVRKDADTAFAAKDYVTAAAKYEQALAFFPLDAERQSKVKDSLCESYCRAGESLAVSDPDKALQFYTKALALAQPSLQASHPIVQAAGLQMLQLLAERKDYAGAANAFPQIKAKCSENEVIARIASLDDLFLSLAAPLYQQNPPQWEAMAQVLAAAEKAQNGSLPAVLQPYAQLCTSGEEAAKAVEQYNQTPSINMPALAAQLTARCEELAAADVRLAAVSGIRIYEALHRSSEMKPLADYVRSLLKEHPELEREKDLAAQAGIITEQAGAASNQEG